MTFTLNDQQEPEITAPVVNGTIEELLDELGNLQWEPMGMRHTRTIIRHYPDGTIEIELEG